MHRSIFCLLRRHITTKGALATTHNGSGSGRCCIQALTKSSPSSSSSVFKCSIHTSLRVRAGDDSSGNVSKGEPKSRKDKRKTPVTTDEEQLQTAAIEAARSLPGDWTRTANELMARLTIHGSSQQSDGLEQEESLESKSTLLSTMKIARSFERTKSRNNDRNGRGISGNDPSVEDKHMINKRRARKSENFNSLYGQPRLGIFDAEKLKAEAGKETKESNEAKDDLWQAVYKEKIHLAKGSLPRNGFEEMIQWTNEGRMWTFPVDNEEDMHEERKYKFHEHVFLSHHLGDFPTEGPLRRFMDLVVLGLSRNPWISVPEKVEHIHWYADYFRQKQQLLETTIGDKAKMKQS